MKNKAQNDRLIMFSRICVAIALTLIVFSALLIVGLDFYQKNNFKYKDYYVSFKVFYDTEKSEYVRFLDDENIVFYYKDEFDYITVVEDFKEPIYFRTFNERNRLYNYTKLKIRNNGICFNTLSRVGGNYYFIRVSKIKGKKIVPTKVIGGKFASERI